MKPRVSFIVPGPPQAWQRTGVCGFTRKDGSIGARLFTQQKTGEYEQRVAFASRAAFSRRPDWVELALSGAVFRLHLHFIRSAVRGDLDNFAKAALDGMKKGNHYKPHPTEKLRGKPRLIFTAGLFRDDAQITQLLLSMHTDPKAEPRTEVLLETASMTLEEPLWMRCAHEAGFTLRNRNERPNEEPTIPVLGDTLER